MFTISLAPKFPTHGIHKRRQYGAFSCEKALVHTGDDNKEKLDQSFPYVVLFMSLCSYVRQFTLEHNDISVQILMSPVWSRFKHIGFLSLYVTAFYGFARRTSAAVRKHSRETWTELRLMYFKQTRMAKATSGSNQMFLIILVSLEAHICFWSTLITVEPAVQRFSRESEAIGSSFWSESV